MQAYKFWLTEIPANLKNYPNSVPKANLFRAIVRNRLHKKKEENKASAKKSTVTNPDRPERVQNTGDRTQAYSARS